VQQGALIALALVLVGQPEVRAKSLREQINRLYGNKGAEVGGCAWGLSWGVIVCLLGRVCEGAGWRSCLERGRGGAAQLSPPAVPCLKPFLIPPRLVNMSPPLACTNSLH
jgi:hypothetical protein